MLTLFSSSAEKKIQIEVIKLELFKTLLLSLVFVITLKQLRPNTLLQDQHHLNHCLNKLKRK